MGLGCRSSLKIWEALYVVELLGYYVLTDSTKKWEQPHIECPRVLKLDSRLLAFSFDDRDGDQTPFVIFNRLSILSTPGTSINVYTFFLAKRSKVVGDRPHSSENESGDCVELRVAQSWHTHPMCCTGGAADHINQLFMGDCTFERPYIPPSYHVLFRLSAQKSPLGRRSVQDTD